MQQMYTYILEVANFGITTTCKIYRSVGRGEGWMKLNTTFFWCHNHLGTNFVHVGTTVWDWILIRLCI